MTASTHHRWGEVEELHSKLCHLDSNVIKLTINDRPIVGKIIGYTPRRATFNNNKSLNPGAPVFRINEVDDEHQHLKDKIATIDKTTGDVYYTSDRTCFTAFFGETTPVEPVTPFPTMHGKNHAENLDVI